MCADWLQEIGDPQGEFIALQLLARISGEAKRRMRQLQREHTEEWLGAGLSRVLRLKSIQFYRGFPTYASLATEGDAAVWERAARDPRLATIEVLSRGRASIERHDQLLEAIRSMRAAAQVCPYP